MTPGLQEYYLLSTDNGQTSTWDLQSFIIIDRCYVHGDLVNAASHVIHNIGFNVISGAIVDSDIRYAVSPGSDSQAIIVTNSPGPILIQNNFISAATENIMFGGADPHITNLTPSDITIVGNHFWKDPAWRGNGLGYNVKNCVEFKHAQRVLLDGNVIENNWADGQQGICIMLTVRNQDGTCTWCVVQDITITHNLIQHVGGGLETTGADNNHPSLTDARILIQNNVFDDVSSANWGGYGNGVFIGSGGGITNVPGNNITVDHNDIFADVEILLSGDSSTYKVDTFRFTNIIGLEGTYTFSGAGTYSAPSLTFSTFFTSLTYNDLLVLTASGSSDGKTYPSGNTYFNSTSGAGFTDYAGGNYQLTVGSTYHNAGTDGKDIGVWDWTTLNAKTNNALAGRYPQ